MLILSLYYKIIDYWCIFAVNFEVENVPMPSRNRGEDENSISAQEKTHSLSLISEVWTTKLKWTNPKVLISRVQLVN